MYEHLSVEEIYDMGLKYINQAHGVLPKWNAASGAEKTAAWMEIDGFTRKAAECFKAAAIRGHLESHYQLALLLDMVQVPEVAFGWALKAAEQGHSDACDFVSKACAEGIGIQKDAQQAEFWHNQAIRYRGSSSSKNDHVMENVAAKMKKRVRDVGICGIVLLILEVCAFFVNPLLPMLLVGLDLLCFSSWEYNMLRGYQDYENTSFLGIRHLLANKIHTVYFFLAGWFSFLCLILLGAAFWCGYKMKQKTVASIPHWDDPASWDLDNYAENGAG